MSDWGGFGKAERRGEKAIARLDLRLVKGLDKLLIPAASFCTSVEAILAEDGSQRPTLHLSETADDATSAMFTFVAVDKNWVVGWI